MATVVDALLITLGLDTKGVDKGMEAARGKITGGLKGIVSAMAAPVMAAFAGFSGAAAISAYTSTAAELDRLSQSLGISMDTLQGWQYAAEAAGAEAAEVGNFFRDMSDYIVDATTFDSGPLKDIAKELGVTLKDARGNLRSTMDVTRDLADAFQRVGSQKAVAFGMQLGLDPGMIALLQKGRTEIEGLIKAQRELGGYTKEDAEIASKAQFAFMSLGRAMQAAAMPVARVLVPVMTVASEKISQAVAFLRRHEPFVKAVFAGVATVITGLLIPASVKLAAVWLANPLTWIIGGIAAAIVAVGLAIDDLIAYMDGGNSVFADFWAIFGTGPEISKALGSAWENLKAIGTAVFAALTGGVRLFYQNFSGVFSGLAQIVTGVLQVIKGLFTADFASIADGIGTTFAGVKDTVLGIFSGIVKSVSDAFWGVVNLVKQWFTDMLDSIPGLNWALEKMGVVDSEESKTATLTPSTADSGNIAAQAAKQGPQNVNATASTHVGTLNVYANDADTAKGMQNAILGAFDKQGKSQSQQIAMAAQTGVVQK